MKSFILTQEEISVCIRGLLALDSQVGLTEKENQLLHKLNVLSVL